MKMHVTKEGRVIKLRDMSDSHLENTIRCIERKAREGLTIRIGTGFDATEMECWMETVYGEEALEWMEYEDYIRERERRMRTTVRHRVIVGNIGAVYFGGLKGANRVFQEYVEQSKSGYGRAAGENVTLLRVESGRDRESAEVVREFIGENDK